MCVLPFAQLIQKLRSKEINGILLDEFTMWLIIDTLKEDAQKIEVMQGDMEFFLNHTIRTQIRHDGQTLYYGVLGKLITHDSRKKVISKKSFKTFQKFSEKYFKK